MDHSTAGPKNATKVSSSYVSSITEPSSPGATGSQISNSGSTSSGTNNIDPTSSDLVSSASSGSSITEPSSSGATGSQISNSGSTSSGTNNIDPTDSKTLKPDLSMKIISSSQSANSELSNVLSSSPPFLMDSSTVSLESTTSIFSASSYSEFNSPPSGSTDAELSTFIVTSSLHDDISSGKFSGLPAHDVSSKFQETATETTLVTITSCSHNVCMIIPTTAKVIKKTQHQPVHTTYCPLTTTQNEAISTTATTTSHNGDGIISSSLITDGVISDYSHHIFGQALSDDLFNITSAATMPFEIQKVSSNEHGSFLVNDGLTANILSFQATSSEDLTRPLSSIVYAVPSTYNYTGSGAIHKPWYISCVFSLVILLTI